MLEAPPAILDTLPTLHELAYLTKAPSFRYPHGPFIAADLDVTCLNKINNLLWLCGHPIPPARCIDIWLIRSQLDFKLAESLNLLPDGLKWTQWCILSEERLLDIGRS